MKSLAIHGYNVVAAAVLAQGSGAAATTLFVAAPAPSAAPARHPVIVARWNPETGGWSERQAFHDPPDETGPATGEGPRPVPALARACAAFAERLAREASQLLAHGTPLSDLPGILPFGLHERGLRAARRKSLDELGHAGWADTIIDAYLDPHRVWAALDATGADYVEHEDELR